ncbi:MAG: VCBS repeat-containing protein, partial [Bacteroidota bacterium]|nr:VCBS repeat-containing protein [Bacteroidota bacterium]
YTSNSCVKAADINGDGFLDLFVGGRVIPGRYPEIPQSFILINDGKGNFSEMTVRLAPEIQTIGMVTDAAWVDLNNNGRKELVIVGEWMPVKVFSNSNGKLIDATHKFFKEKYIGWWNKILVDDFNGDGIPDLVIGNFGLNSQVKANSEEPSSLYFKDFDDNGSVDPILSFYIQGKTYPYVTRDELLDQLSMMRTRFPDYKSYSDASLTDIFTEEELKDVSILEANFLKTSYFENTTSGQFRVKTLPIEAQFSPIYSILSLDYNKDGKKDLLLCGNINQARLRFGKYDANYGVLLRGDGKGNFMSVPQSESGFKISGDVRSILNIDDILLFGINQNDIKAYKNQATSTKKIQ